jgi:2-dehydro-3-deoxy-D-arabinonate dehydratase
MQLAKIRLADGQTGAALVSDSGVTPLREAGRLVPLATVLEAIDPRAMVQSLTTGVRVEILPLGSIELVAPIDEQEVWAAGVTYKRSQVARMEESKGAASFYDQVYVADRPELFFKATPHRVRGPNEPLRIRQDATWSVPEPELALVINSRLELVGFTIGNDMSSRDIEGRNPLYLPQAKLYDACCGLGPWITFAADMPPAEGIGIELAIRRGGQTAFSGSTSVGQMARSFEDLMSWLARDNSFPTGVVLLTGTGIVPPDHFTLQPDDEVTISVAGIGSLTNSIVRGG